MIVLIGGTIMSCSKTISNKQYDSKFYEKGKFKNEEVSYNVEFVKSMPLMWDFVFNKPKNATPQKEIPIIELTQNDLYNLEDNSVIRLAHSTLLLKLDHEFYLTDPVFSKRASPYSFIGPKRFHESPINIENLPPIKAVILSHDHYDHLDEEAIKKLKNKVETFYVPLGVGDHLISFGVEEKNIIEGLEKSADLAERTIVEIERFYHSLNVDTQLKNYDGDKQQAIENIIKQLKAHGMVKLGENQAITLEKSHEILELAVE